MLDLSLLNDEQFITQARLTPRTDLTLQHMVYIKGRLDRLGYTIEYGCCGVNNIRKKQNEKKND